MINGDGIFMNVKNTTINSIKTSESVFNANYIKTNNIVVDTPNNTDLDFKIK